MAQSEYEQIVVFGFAIFHAHQGMPIFEVAAIVVVEGGYMEYIQFWLAGCHARNIAGQHRGIVVHFDRAMIVDVVGAAVAHVAQHAAPALAAALGSMLAGCSDLVVRIDRVVRIVEAGIVVAVADSLKCPSTG